ncbi:ECF transporter S component [Carnobacterium maltaromaticum]|uniref:ECF transporter S component n=1 Tax=Carnobacterium maltaromaticum TaxID=2751 RepID=UPI00295EB5DF|nr:ECF transporter S component [Carnobacterium maltaromaticum]
MLRAKKNLWGLILFLIFMLVLSVAISDKYYLLVSFLFLIATMVPLYRRFETKKIRSREIVFIAVLGAIAATSRVPFAMIPSVQPTTFVIIVSAMVLGSESGFVVGATAALVSNMFLGQGPWTPWQMFCWGMVGFTAGLLKDSPILKDMWSRLVFGFIWGFLFGWIMNLWYVVAYINPLSWFAFVQAYAASFYFDLAHALSNVFFLWLFSTSWLKIIRRFQKKYGLINLE